MDSLFQPTETLTEPTLPVPVLQDVAKHALTNRPELKRIQSEEVAQRESVARAKSSFGPRVNAVHTGISSMLLSD
jgi:outer membrane protein TolC